MVTAGAVFESEQTMSLQAAIMIYGNHSNLASFATAHNVAFSDKGVPSLLEGHPLTMEILNKLLAAVAKGAESKRTFNGFLPENVLAVGLGSIVWWLPAADRSISFACNDELIGTRGGTTPHPSLVFGVNDGNWMVFAVKGNSRPTPDTKLWQAPYFNVWSSGRICQGTTQVPPGATTSQIDGWNKSFFSSNFSHPNVHAKGKLLRYKGGAYRFWLDALEGHFNEFPQRVLVGTNHTLADFIEATLNGGTL